MKNADSKKAYKIVEFEGLNWRLERIVRTEATRMCYKNECARCEETTKLQIATINNRNERATPDRRTYQVLLFRTNTRASRTEAMTKEDAVAYSRG
jgi:hypothetical protein